MGFVLLLSEYMVFAAIAILCSAPGKPNLLMKKWGIKERFVPLLDAPEMILIPGLRRPLFDVTLVARYGAGWFSFHLECLMAALAIFMNGFVMEMLHFLCIAHVSSFIG